MASSVQGIATFVMTYKLMRYWKPFDYCKEKCYNIVIYVERILCQYDKKWEEENLEEIHSHNKICLELINYAPII
jgi:hypothetical protein